MSPRVRAVMDRYRVIFCQGCMPAGDQLAEVAHDARDQLRREAFKRATAPEKE